KNCTSALALVPFSVKPLLRRASAHEALEQCPLAYVDYKTVLQIDDSVMSALEGVNRTPRALVDSLGPEWRLKLPSIPLVPVSAQKRRDSEYHKEIPKGKSKETTTAKSRVPSGDVERAHVHRALCYLALKQYKEAVKDCTEALKLDGKNVKAFYRRAQAYKALKDYKSSFADINSLLKIEPKNVPAQKLQQEVNQKLN
ncbi:Mitochondrial import receptor subunit TOM34, partial [Myotis brandtii]